MDAEYPRGVFLATGTAQGRLGQLTDQELDTCGGPPTYEGYAYGLASITKIVRDGVKPGPVAQQPEWTEADFESLLNLMVRNYRIHATGTAEHD